ncbi:3-keto-disaccharide hydrolase [Spirosoma flavus]
MAQTIVSLGLLFSLTCADVWSQAANTLSAEEKKKGWKLLFNGHDVSGWHSYGSKDVGKAWKVDQGTLKLDVANRGSNKAENGGDLVTDATFTGDFDLKLEWKITRFANSGIFLFVQEEPQYKNISNTGLEIQVLDDAIYEGTAENKHRAGDLFCVATANDRQLQPVGEWNQVHCKVRNNKLIVWLNGTMIQEHDLTSDDWKQRITSSKLKNAPISKGRFSGRIGLQDWGSEVSFRNIKFRSLPKRDSM